MLPDYETVSKTSNEKSILFSDTSSHQKSPQPTAVQVHQRSAPVLSPRAGDRSSSRLSPPTVPKERRFSRCSAVHPASTDRIREAFG